MRLLDVSTGKLHSSYDEKIPPYYAILSHSWGKENEEVTFAQIQNPESCRDKPGFEKIKFLCEQAAADGLPFAWIDTCCIAKSSSAELSEAINSMFAWYYKSTVCYAYLADIDHTKKEDFLTSRWWTRSWTLQELLAPLVVKFYDKNWIYIGEKATLAKQISAKTRIDVETLIERKPMFYRSIAQRMSWAASREATRVEDIAYSLLGIFGINMSLHYGEGRSAFIRLQRKIMRNTNDQSLFAWGFSRRTIYDIVKNSSASEANESNLQSPMEFSGLQESFAGMFAHSPSRFKDCGNVVFHHRYAPDTYLAEVGGSMQMEMPLVNTPRGISLPHGSYGYKIGLLPCSTKDAPHDLVGLLLRQWTPRERFERISPGFHEFTFLVHPDAVSGAKTEKVWIDNSFRVFQNIYTELEPSRQISIVLNPRYMPPDGFLNEPYKFIGALPSPWAWSPARSALTLVNASHEQERMILGYFNKDKGDMICILLALRVWRDHPPSAPPSQLGIEVTSLPASDASKLRLLGQALNDSDSLRNTSTISINTFASLTSQKVFNHYIYTLELTPMHGTMSLRESTLRA